MLWFAVLKRLIERPI